MFVATGQLALRATGTPWSAYFRVQLSGIIAGAVTCATAISIRLLLEAHQASPVVITFAILAAAAVPWSLAMIWQLGKPDFEPLRAQLPRWGVQLVDAFHHLARRSRPESSEAAVYR
jgi:hypothetical protein